MPTHTEPCIQHRPGICLNHEGTGVIEELCESDGVSEATLLDFVNRKRAFVKFCGSMYGRTPEEIERWDSQLCGGEGQAPTGATYDESQRMTVFSRILAYTYEHPSLPDQFAARYVCGQPWLDDMLGHKNPTQFAESVGVKKQRVNQAVAQAYDYFSRYKLPLRAGMRGEIARANMSIAYRNGKS